MELRDASPQIQRDGARIVAVSTDPFALSRSVAQMLDRSFPILWDQNGRLGRAFGIYDLPEMSMGPVDRHAIFIISATGRVLWKRVSLRRMYVPMAAVLAAVKEPH